MSISMNDLLSDDDDERDAAEKALAKAPDAERQKLLASLTKELDKRIKKDDFTTPWTRAETALLLLKLPEATSVVTALARHADEGVRASLVSVYADLGPLPAFVVALASDASADVRGRVFAKLVDGPTAAALPALLEQATTKQDSEEDVLKALGACARLGTDADRAKAEAILSEALDAKKAERREGAIGAFSQMRSASPEVRAKLKKHADAKRPQTKYAAIGALAAVGDETEARLSELIETGARGELDAADSATLVLAFDIDAALTVPALEKAMVHENPLIRAFGVREVTTSPGKRALLDLAKVEALLADADDEVRATAAASAGEITEHKARFLPKLKALLKDKSKAVKSAAKEAITLLDYA